MRNEDRLNSARVALRLCFGLVPVVAGLDKFTSLLTDWSQYVAPLAADLLPVSVQTFLRIVGVVEVGVGTAILTRWPVIGSYVAALWLSLVAVNVGLAGYFDVAVRDAVLAVAAFALARLSAEPTAGSPVRWVEESRLAA